MLFPLACGRTDIILHAVHFPLGGVKTLDSSHVFLFSSALRLQAPSFLNFLEWAGIYKVGIEVMVGGSRVGSITS